MILYDIILRAPAASRGRESGFPAPPVPTESVPVGKTAREPTQRAGSVASGAAALRAAAAWVFPTSLVASGAAALRAAAAWVFPTSLVASGAAALRAAAAPLYCYKYPNLS